MNPLRDVPESYDRPELCIEPRHRLWLERGEFLGRWLRSLVSTHRHPVGPANPASERLMPHEADVAGRGADGGAPTATLNSEPTAIPLAPAPAESDRRPDNRYLAYALIGIFVLLLFQTAYAGGASELPVNAAHGNSSLQVASKSPGANRSPGTMLEVLIDSYRADLLDDYTEDMRHFDPPARPETPLRVSANKSPKSVPPYTLCRYFHSSEFSNGAVKRQQEPYALAVRYENDPCAHLLPDRGRKKQPAKTIDSKFLREIFHRPEFNRLDGLDVY